MSVIIYVQVEIAEPLCNDVGYVEYVLRDIGSNIRDRNDREDSYQTGKVKGSS